MDLCHPETVRVAASHQAEAEKIAAELAAIASSGMVLPGSITQRRTRCGRRNCACHADPPRLHGPYWQWTRKVAAKTICRWLSAGQHQDYQPWIDNDRRLRELLARLEALGAAALDADPRWERQTPGTNVGTARLTRGRPPNPAANNQFRAKREDVSSSSWEVFRTIRMSGVARAERDALWLSLHVKLPLHSETGVIWRHDAKCSMGLLQVGRQRSRGGSSSPGPWSHRTAVVCAGQRVSGCCVSGSCAGQTVTRTLPIFWPVPT